MAGSNTVQSVERALDLLLAVAANDGGIRLGDLAARQELNLSTAHNLVRTLIGRGFLAKGDDQRLRIGPAVAGILALEQDRSLLQAAATAALALQRDLPEAVINVGEPVGDEVRVRLRLSPDLPEFVQRPLAQTSSIHGSAVGLCVLAFADRATSLRLRERQPFHEHGVSLWRTPETLDAHLAQARAQGHVTTPFAQQELWRVAAPIRDRNGTFRAAIGLALPIGMADPARRERAVSAVLAAAAAVTAGLP